MCSRYDVHPRKLSLCSMYYPFFGGGINKRDMHFLQLSAYDKVDNMQLSPLDLILFSVVNFCHV